jgi:hypothetical protein
VLTSQRRERAWHARIFALSQRQGELQQYCRVARGGAVEHLVQQAGSGIQPGFGEVQGILPNLGIGMFERGGGIVPA